MKNRIIALCVMVNLALCLCSCDSTSYLSSADQVMIDTGDEGSFEEESSDTDQDEDSVIFVQVAGAVRSPGVFQLSADSRVFHAIDAAGGLRKDADDASINQAERITDGQKIIVYTKKQSARLVGDLALQENSETESGDGLININSADKDALMSLPGIGSAKADAIIAYRQDNGSFSKIEELKDVSGIGDGVFSRISGSIKV